VGKSTVTSQLAFALAKAGARVGVLDADIYGPSQLTMLGGESEAGTGKQSPEGKLIPAIRNGVKFVSMGMYMPKDGPVVWRAPMAMKMLSQFLNQVEWGELDYLLMDLPPGTGDVQLTLAQQAQLSGAVIVSTPQQVALGITQKGVKMFQNVNVPILGIVENMSGFTCSHCGEETAVFKKGGAKKLAQELSVPFLGAIPLDPSVMNFADEGKSVVLSAPESHAAHAFESVASQLESRIVSAAPGAVLLEPSRAETRPDGALQITWQDGKKTVLSGQQLRQNCGCAGCVDENTGQRILDVSKIPTRIFFSFVNAA
jgi:ATP-binding protein involved in chromosome partitioning